MPTFLITPKMSPELAARVESSVTGRRVRSSSAKRQRARRVVSLARVVLVLTAAFAIYLAVTTRRQSQRDVESARAALLEAARAQGASLTEEEKHAVSRAEGWIVSLTAPYEGDVVRNEVRVPGAIEALVAKPFVYVRGVVDGLSSLPKIAQTAASSMKDPFVLCLVEPPASRSEAALLDKVRVAYSGGINLESRVPNVKRLHDAIVGLPFLLPPWSETVRIAADRAELTHLRRDFDGAPIERAKNASRAGLLLVAMDEPGDGTGPTELDGERPHPIRVALADVSTGKVLFRVRRAVDPSWIAPALRPTYASGLDGCALALDVLEQVKGAAIAKGRGAGK